MTRASVSTFGLALVLAAATAGYAQAPAAGGGQARGGGRGPAGPPCAGLACDLLTDWQRSAQQIIPIADKMPEDKWGYKSTPAQRSYGEQVMHIVQIDSRLLAALGGKTPPPAVDPKAAASKAESMAALRASMAWGEALIKEFTDAQWAERVNGPFGMGSASRLRVAYGSMQHGQDIYGQMVVYLRLNGLVPPASDRP